MTREEYESFMLAYDLCSESERRQTHGVAISEIGLTRDLVAKLKARIADLERRLAESEAGAARMRAELLSLRELVSDPERKSIDRVLAGEE